MRLKAICILITGMLCLVSGCAAPEPEPLTLTVRYPSVQSFYKRYGYAFEDKYPHITVQVVQDPMEQTDDAPGADVVFMHSLPLYSKRIEEGRLKDLTPLMKRDGFPPDTFSPAVLDLLRHASPDGNLYGLAPAYSSDALYYNKSLFRLYGVPEPRNRMTWSEVFELAGRFPKTTDSGKPLYGFQMNFYKNVALNILLEVGKTEGLSYIDPATYRITMNTEGWRSVWFETVEAFRSGAIRDTGEGEEEGIAFSPFFRGEAAMMVGSFMDAYNFDVLSRFPDGSVIDWGMVTVPVSRRHPDLSSAYALHEIYGVSADASHPEEAWELVKFIAADAGNNRFLARNEPNRGLPALTDAIQPVPPHDLTPLYMLEANTAAIIPYLLVDATVSDAFQDVAQKLLDQAIQEEITIEEALEQAELQGQQAVNEALRRLGINP
jgi:ABC-type glycerol-3-phosphate transport system substrate-binding protein